MLEKIKNNIIYEVISGSTAYGLSDENSDKDKKGIYVIPFQEIIDIFKPMASSPVCDKKRNIQIFELRHYISLLCKGTPEAIELLWTPDRFVITKSPLMDELIEHRSSFLSMELKNVFIGYARAQIKRLKNHKKRLDIIAKPEKPHIKDYIFFEGLNGFRASKEESVKAVFSEDYICTKSNATLYKVWKQPSNLFHGNILLKWDKTNKLHHFDLSMEAIKKNELTFQGFFYIRMKAYEIAKAEYENYTDWHANRNKKRAAMEAQFGMDCKHAAHSLRALNTALDIFSKNEVKFLRDEDRQELFDIKYGETTYETFQKIFAERIEQVNAAAQKASLPAKPDKKLLQEIYENIVQKTWGLSWLP